MNAAVKQSPDFVIKDLGLADWGRKEIRIAETEMPGLMAIRAPRSGWEAAHSRRIAMSPGISVSAMRISLRPQSARPRSLT